MPYIKIIMILWGALLFNNVAIAQMAQNLLIGNAKALALGQAVTADPPGIDSIHYNPAGLARLKGKKAQFKLVYASLDVYTDLISTPEYEQMQLDYHPTVRDPAANTRSEVEKFSVYIPGEGGTPISEAIAPLGGASFNPVGTNITFGTAVYSPMMVGVVRNDNDPALFFGKELTITRLTYFSPTVAFEIKDNLSVGFGVGFSYVGIGMDFKPRFPQPALKAAAQGIDFICGRRDDLSSQFVYNGPDDLDFCAGGLDPYAEIFDVQIDLFEPVSLTYNIGLLWEATPWLSFGIAYQSEAKDSIDGTIDIKFNDDINALANGVAGDNQNIRNLLESYGWPLDTGRTKKKGTLDLVLPAHLAVGTSIQITPDLKVNIDVKWTETGKWDELDFEVKDLRLLELLQVVDGISAKGVHVPRYYEDTINWGIGLEWSGANDISYRFGYEPRKAGIPKDKLDGLFPIGDMDVYAIGLSKKLKHGEVLDVTLAYGKSDQFIKSGSSTNGNDTNPGGLVYNPAAGMDLHNVVEMYLLEFSYLFDFGD